jgi:hypothetical protein
VVPGCPTWCMVAQRDFRNLNLPRTPHEDGLGLVLLLLAFAFPFAFADVDDAQGDAPGQQEHGAGQAITAIGSPAPATVAGVEPAAAAVRDPTVAAVALDLRRGTPMEVVAVRVAVVAVVAVVRRWAASGRFWPRRVVVDALLEKWAGTSKAYGAGSTGHLVLRHYQAPAAPQLGSR